MTHPSLYKYLNDQGDFICENGAESRTTYFPLCGPTARNIKSAVTPYLSGDIKIDKDRYLTKPVSTQDLRNPLRSFYLHTPSGVFSVGDPHDDHITTAIEAGQLWFDVTRTHAKHGLSTSVLTFVPSNGDNVELIRFRVTNVSDQDLTVTPTAAVPLFARALSNKHDHEHVTSLLHRTRQTQQGVIVTPTMRFNEEGHLANMDVYFVAGCEGDGTAIQGTFPTIESFCGAAGDLFRPEAVVKNHAPVTLSEEELNGKEVAGALRFKTVTLKPGASRDYIVMTGMVSHTNKVAEVFERYSSTQNVEAALAANIKYWADKTESIVFRSGDENFNAWMRWVVLQPVLRRIFGCSFLPDHDYGKGGKGWRDIWQDLLSLILIEPEQIKSMLVDNFAGVRMDGSNATIIGSGPGEFVADRNAISRVWMDHGVWPLQTVMLYVHQTGDYGILLKEVPYFKDRLLSRTRKKDDLWTDKEGNTHRDESGEEVRGTVIEHLLIQHLVQFFNVGEHNIIRLEHADWNDGLDMAYRRGESVTFASFYAGNLVLLAQTVEDLADELDLSELELSREVQILLDTLGSPIDYNDIKAKTALLFEQYCNAVEPNSSGEKVRVEIRDLARDLRKKGEWLFEHIRRQEKVTVGPHTWFNGYYDNVGQRVEGECDDVVRMTLTGQVFPLMSGLADDKDIEDVIESVRTYLKDPKLGGFRLNSDFKKDHYLELGRAFGFAFGTKENGAFFSHMIVMYAFALYKRNAVHAGYEVLKSIYDMSVDTDQSRIFPGVPEYFDSTGLGMYHYLTGSASWLVLTQLTQVFGVVGHRGDLSLHPKLVKEQFSDAGTSGVSCHFASKRIHVNYENPQQLDFPAYGIGSVGVNGQVLDLNDAIEPSVTVPRSMIESCDGDVEITVKLVARK